VYYSHNARGRGVSMYLALKLASLLSVLAAVASATPIDVGSQAALQAATVYPNQKMGRAPGILVLGGAEGGDKWAKDVAQRLAAEGYIALPVAYFHAPGLQDQLQLIPIERLKAGVDLLVRDPRVDPRRIGVVGLSKGAEAALVLASIDARIRAVVAGSPSDVVWQGIDRKAGTIKSSWSVAGRPLPFVPFAACEDCRSLSALYVRSRGASVAVAAAGIPVERIRGPILLFSSERDTVWPSEAMAVSLKKRLESHHFRYPVLSWHYTNGGHFTLGPLAEQDAASDAGFGGGTAEGVLAARRDSWTQMRSFLHNAFYRN
jgi:dienelactone hydrolase